MTGQNSLLVGPILPTLLRFALPNLGAMVATALAAIAETSYVGRLGLPALAGMALVFPFVMLQSMLSAGAMGGGVSSAVSRALGAGDSARANVLAVHALWIALALGTAYMALMELFGGNQIPIDDIGFHFDQRGRPRIDLFRPFP